MHALRRSYWFVLACIVWLASIPLINIYHDVTVHPMGEAGHHAASEVHVSHHSDSQQISSYVSELICDGWHGYIDNPSLAASHFKAGEAVLNTVSIDANTEAARHGQRLSPRTRAPPTTLS